MPSYLTCFGNFKKPIATMMAVILLSGGLTPLAMGESATGSTPLRNAQRRASNIPIDTTPTEKPRALTRDAFAGFSGRSAWRVENQLFPFITHIEDNHGNAHAQWAAVNLLDQIDTERGDAPLLIGVEGAWTPLDLRALEILPPGDWRARWWKHLLWRGDITGEEYWVLSRAPSRVALVGVDDPSLHEQNTEARRQLEYIQPAAQRDLQSLRARLTRLKPLIDTGPWSALNRALSSDPTAADGAQALARQIQAIVPQGWAEIHLPNLSRLARLEGSPPTPKAVQGEIERLLSLAPQESARLFSTTKSSEGDLFLRRLLSLAEERKVALPLTRRYADQRALNAALDPVGLSQEMDSAPDTLASLLLPAGSRSRALFEADRTLAALESVLALTATPSEWARLRDEEEKRVLARLDQTLRAMEKTAGLPTPSRTDPSAVLVQSFSTAKNFYQLAESRNDAMAVRLITEARERNTERCVLVAGGFHTPGMAALFRRWGAPFEVLCPVPSLRPSLREIDGFQDPGRRDAILQKTAAALSAQDPPAAREWVSRLSKDERESLDQTPTLLIRLFRWGMPYLRRAAHWITTLIIEHQEAVRRMHRARGNRGFLWSNLMIGPAYLLPPSVHQAPAEWQPDSRKPIQGNDGFATFHEFVNQQRWKEAENWLWSLSAVDGSTRRAGQAFMELAPATRDLMAQAFTPGTLGLMGDAMTEYARTQDLERLFQLRRENIKINAALVQIPQNTPVTNHSAVPELKNALQTIERLLLNEASDVWGMDDHGIPGLELMDEGDADIAVVNQSAQRVETEARALAKTAQTLAQGWATGLNGPWRETNEFISATKKHLQAGIKDVAFPTATATNDLNGVARAKLRAVREWARLRRSLPKTSRGPRVGLVTGAWRAAEIVSRSLTEGKLMDPLAATPLTVSAYGAVPENAQQIQQAQTALRQPGTPIVVLDVPYDAAKDTLLKDLAAALAGTAAEVAGPRRLLRVQLSQLGETVPLRLSALRTLMENAEALERIALAIDVDEADPLFHGVDAPFNNLLQTWRGLAHPPPLVFLSSRQTHARHLNQATNDQAPIVSFPTGKASAHALLAMEAERIAAAGPCPVADETIGFLTDTIFSRGTVDFEEALRALRWAAARRIVNGDQNPLRPSDLPLQTEVPFRELAVSRQYKIAKGRTTASYADRLKIAYNEWLAAPRDSAFYTQALAFLQHALRLSHLFPKEAIQDPSPPLSDADIAAERQRARRFFDEKLHGLDEQKDAVIDTYITKELMNRGDRADAPFDILCLVGPPSAGKSELARLLGEYTEKNVVRIDAAAASAGSEIFGTVRTYVGAQPGRPALAMEENETDDLLFIIEELGNATPAFFTALNRFLDKRHDFEDHYHQVPIKRGRIKIIINTNYWDRIPAEIRDRLIRVDFPKYTSADFKNIGASITWPKVAREFSFPKGWAHCPDPAALVGALVDHLPFDTVREMERRLQQIHEAAIVAALAAPDENRPIIMDIEFLNHVFGPPPSKNDWSTPPPVPGHLTGLGVLGENEGTLLPVQVHIGPEGSGIVLTGSAGTTMQTSVVTVGNTLRGLARRSGNPLSARHLDSLDLTVHLPGLANPKDGDSAGAAITLGGVSALTGRHLNPDLAVTGAVQADGQITAVGGISAKVNAARSKGKKLIVVPYANRQSLHTALEKSEEREAVLLESGNSVELFIPQGALTEEGQAMMTGAPPSSLPPTIKARAVQRGLYLKGTPADLAPWAARVSLAPPLTVLLAKRIDTLVNDPRVLLPVGEPEPAPAILRSTRERSKQDADSAPPTDKEPPKSKRRAEGDTAYPKPVPPSTSEHSGPKTTDNVYTTAANLPLKTYSGEINPDQFLSRMSLDERIKTLTTLLETKTVDAFAALEALLRALWVLSPAEAGQCFEALFNSKKGPLFTQVPPGAVGLGVPALAHFLAAIEDAAIAHFTTVTMAQKIEIVNKDLASLASKVPADNRWKDYYHTLTAILSQDHTTARNQAQYLAQQPGGSRIHQIVLRYWTNRQNRLQALSETASLGQLMAENVAKAEDRDGAIREFRAHMTRVLQRYLNFMETEQAGLETGRLDEVQEGLRHPLAQVIAQTRLENVRLEMMDWMTRGMGPRGDDIERHGRRLAGIQRSLSSLESSIAYGTFRDRSRRLAEPLGPSDWAAPALALAAETVANPGNRIGVLVAPSRHQRAELPNLIAAHLQRNSDLPLLAKTARVLELDFSQIHSADPEELMERLESYATTARAAESTLLTIDIPALKSRCGTGYARMMNRLIHTASGPSDHPPLALIFTTDPDSNALVADEVPFYVDQAHVVTLPPLSQSSITATLEQLGASWTADASLSIAPGLWQAALKDGRMAEDIDEAIEVLMEAVGEARQGTFPSVDETLLNRVIERRDADQKANETLVKKAEREIPNIPDEAAKRRGLEFLSWLKNLGASDANRRVIVSNYLTWLLKWNWNPKPEPPVSLADIKAERKRARRVLDDTLIGQEELKKRILEIYLGYLWKRHRGLEPPLPVIGLLGPYGAGKTTVMEAIARVFNFAFEEMSLAGESDPRRLKGTGHWIVGAMPSILYQLQVHGEEVAAKEKKNGVAIAVDEIDKSVVSHLGNPLDAFLYYTDTSQRATTGVNDEYLGLANRWIRTLFMTTFNREDVIPPAQLSRMEIINVPQLEEAKMAELGQSRLLERTAREQGLDLIPETGLDPSAPADRSRAGRRLDFGTAQERMTLFDALMKDWVAGGPRDLERQITRLLLNAAAEVRREAAKAGYENRKPKRVRVEDLPRLLGSPVRERGLQVALAPEPDAGEALFYENGPGAFAVWDQDTPGQPAELFWSRNEIDHGTAAPEEREVIVLLSETLKLVWAVAHHRFSGALAGKQWIMDLHGVRSRRSAEGALACFMALASRAFSRPLGRDRAFFGEIDLAGRLLVVPDLEQRLLRARADDIMKYHANLSPAEIGRLMGKHPRLAGWIVQGQRRTLIIPTPSTVTEDSDPADTDIPKGRVDRSFWSEANRKSVLKEASMRQASLTVHEGFTEIVFESADAAQSFYSGTHLPADAIPAFYINHTVDEALRDSGINTRTPPSTGAQSGGGKDSGYGVTAVFLTLVAVGLLALGLQDLVPTVELFPAVVPGTPGFSFPSVKEVAVLIASMGLFSLTQYFSTHFKRDTEIAAPYALETPALAGLAAFGEGVSPKTREHIQTLLAPATTGTVTINLRSLPTTTLTALRDLVQDTLPTSPASPLWTESRHRLLAVLNSELTARSGSVASRLSRLFDRRSPPRPAAVEANHIPTLTNENGIENSVNTYFQLEEIFDKQV